MRTTIISSSRAMAAQLVRSVLLFGVYVTLVMRGETMASTITVDNVTSKTVIYTYDQVSTTTGGSGTISVEVPPMSKKYLGGGMGEGFTQGTEVNNYHLQSTNYFAAVQFTPEWIDGSPLSYTQTASILAAADGVSGVFTYFDFNTPNYNELVANQSFLFDGFEGNRVPILTLTSDPSTRITDASGQLLPQYQFTGQTEIIGLTSIQPFSVPEPSTLTISSVGIIFLLTYTWCCRKATTAAEE
jgi:hypothetical protein